MDVKKTKEMEKLDYICYETPSGKGTFYNITFQLNEEKGYKKPNINFLDGIFSFSSSTV